VVARYYAALPPKNAGPERAGGEQARRLGSSPSMKCPRANPVDTLIMSAISLPLPYPRGCSPAHAHRLRPRCADHRAACRTPVFFMATTTNFPPKTFASSSTTPRRIQRRTLRLGLHRRLSPSHTDILAKRACGLKLVHIPFNDGVAGILKGIAGGDTQCPVQRSVKLGRKDRRRVRPLASLRYSLLPACRMFRHSGIGLHRLPPLAMVKKKKKKRRSLQPVVPAKLI